VAQDTVEALAFSLSMGVAASCPEAICESTDAVPQIIVVEQVASHGLEPGDLEQVQEVPVESTVTATYVEARTISKIKRSLLLEKKLHTDTEIMRGVPVKSTLRNFGRIWRKSPLDMSELERAKLWDAAVPVEQFDVFLSHTWHTRGIWKWLSLSLQLTWPHILLCGFVACLLLELLFFVDLLPALGDQWQVSFQGYEGTAPFSLWAIIAEGSFSLLPFLLAPWMPCTKPYFAFLDVASINQADEELKERGIYGIGGFLKASKELRILWSRPYLSRLWCIFEIAAFLRGNPEGRIVLQPLFVEVTVLVCWLGMHVVVVLWLLTMVFLSSLGNYTLFVALAPFLAVFHSLRKNFLLKRQLFKEIQNFDLAAVECRSSFDKEFVHAAIAEWYGGEDAFTEYVRGPLQKELMTTQPAGIQISYCMILVAPFLSVGISTFVGLLKAGVPLHILISYFFAAVVGLWFCWVAAMVQFAMFLCDRLARPLIPRVDFLQTLFIFTIFVLTAFSGLQFGIRAYRDSLATSIIWSAVSVFLLWLTNGGLAKLSSLRMRGL